MELGPTRWLIYDAQNAPDRWVRDVSDIRGVSIERITGDTEPTALVVTVANHNALGELERRLSQIHPDLKMMRWGTAAPGPDREL